jgi:hypothetical protein
MRKKRWLLPGGRGEFGRVPYSGKPLLGKIEGSICSMIGKPLFTRARWKPLSGG